MTQHKLTVSGQQTQVDTQGFTENFRQDQIRHLQSGPSNRKTEQHSFEPLHSAPRLEKNRRLINRGCHHIGKQKQTINQNCHATSLHTITSFLKHLADPRVPSRVCPGLRRTDPGSRRRGRWVTTGLANQLSVAQNVGKRELPNSRRTFLQNSNHSGISSSQSSMMKTRRTYNLMSLRGSFIKNTET